MNSITTAYIDGPEAKGNVTIIQLNTQEYEIQLTNFWVAVGAPDVRIVFSESPDGIISRETMTFIAELPNGHFSKSFRIPLINNFENMKTLIVYCEKFFVHFGHGSLIKTNL